MTVTVVIPLYNKAHFIKRSIDSVLQQSYQDFHIIVVNDGSTDEGPEIVSSINDSRIHLVSQTNQGVSAARNRGIAESTDEYVAFLDADDEWKSDMLSTMVNLHERYPDCGVFGTRFERIGSNGDILPAIVHKIYFGEEGGLLTNYFEVAAHSDPPFCSSSMMISKKAMNVVGGFPTNIKQGEDLLTWARLAIRFPIAYSMKSLAVFYTQRNTYGKPVRIPPKDDIVGNELEALYLSHPNIQGLKEYVGSWHKMRASMFMRLHHYGSDARAEIHKSLRWNPKVKQLYLYWLLLLLPYSLRMKLLATRA